MQGMCSILRMAIRVRDKGAASGFQGYSNCWRICWRMIDERRVSFQAEVALVAAEALAEQIALQCEQVQIAGSLRRGKNSVGDIELVALPVVEEREIAPVAAQLTLFGEATGGTASSVQRVSLLEVRLDELAAQMIIHKARPHLNEKGRWGEKYKQFWISLDTGKGMGYIKVDLFIVIPPAQWGPIFTIRTGSADFVGRDGLMKYILTRTPYRQSEGRLIIAETGEEIETPTERDYFAALNLPWIEPRDRTVDKFWKVARSRRVALPPFSSEGDPITGNVSSQVRVVNVKSLPKTWQNDPAYADHVYIGRAHRAKKLPGSVWGNPFVVGRDGNRAQVIEKYRAWIETQPHLLQMIPHLATQTGALVCWCAPLPCHGDVLCEYIERWRCGEWKPPSRKGSMGWSDVAVRTQIREHLEGKAGFT